MNEQRKKMLIILNPYSGQKKANRHIINIVSLFTASGWDCTLHITQSSGDATEYTKNYGSEFELIVCIGGDGTLNEVITGLADAGLNIPIGYIPSGSTNDFASSLNISKNVMQAARDILNGTPHIYDIGAYNDKYFCYVASFGAFTKSSYDTPQTLKNTLGHLAYVVESIKELPVLKPVHAKITADGEVYENDYMFAAVSNSLSVAGVLSLSPEQVNMSDGLLEVMLIKNPKTPAELSQLAWALTMQQYNCEPIIQLISAETIEIELSDGVDWTLDGEFSKGVEKAVIKNMHNAITVIK